MELRSNKNCEWKMWNGSLLNEPKAGTPLKA